MIKINNNIIRKWSVDDDNDEDDDDCDDDDDDDDNDADENKKDNSNNIYKQVTSLKLNIWIKFMHSHAPHAKCTPA